MEVVRKGKPTSKECGNCGSLLKYEPLDRHQSQVSMNEYKYYITCPVCNCEIEVD
jgi:hypothetical protein